MEYVVNLVLVMQLLFLVLAAGKTEISSLLIKRVIEVYRDSDVKFDVHEAIEKSVAKSKGFTKGGRDEAFETVDELLNRYCESTEISLLTDKIMSAKGLAAEP